VRHLRPEPSLVRVTRRQLITAAAAAAGASVARPVRALPSLLPSPPGVVFTSGVASGDPSVDGVVLWTRVADAFHGADVRWEVYLADDPARVLRHGSAPATADRDGTVEVVVDGLPAGTTLGYTFRGPGGATISGVTRTLPSDPSSLRVGVVSCSKYSDGYFNGYRALAAMGCDVVLHLGDYIYASATDASGDPLGRWQPVAGRDHEPDRETMVLADYRTRYRQYRSDPDLQLLHASVPVVTVWDDNDIANNAFRDGNQAGQRGEEWAARKRDGQRAWREYHPSRVPAADAAGDLRIWRRLRAGSLVDLVMLDTRLQRDEQVSNAAAGSTRENDDPDRTMLGAEQLAWLRGVLADGGAAWRVLGQGLVMAHWRVVGGPQEITRLRELLPLVEDTAASDRLADGGVYWNSDGWDGYAHERDRLFEDFARTPGDVIVLTGDVHSSWANELVPEADPANAPVGVELVAPGLSTRPFAANVYGATPVFEAAFTAANPWIKQVDMDANGFLVVDLDEARAVARWFQVATDRPGAPATPLMAWETARGSHRLLPVLPAIG
jgi:alkaline phosphatase D